MSAHLAGGWPRGTATGQECALHTLPGSVSPAEDPRDPCAGTHPHGGGYTVFKAHMWTSKCAPHAPKGCWERGTQANMRSVETRAAAPRFWLTESSPNHLWFE